MSNPLIHSITISTAAGDGTIISVSRTRLRRRRRPL